MCLWPTIYAFPEMITVEIGGWNDLGTVHKIYTHLAKKDIAKNSKKFSDYFDAAEMEKRESGNGNEKELGE